MRSHDLHSLPLPATYVSSYGPNQPLSAQVDALVVRLMGRLGRWEPAPDAAFGMESYLRIHVGADVLAVLRLERRRPTRTVFFQGFPVEVGPWQRDRYADVVTVSCDVDGGEGYLAPAALPPSAAEVYVRLRCDGVEAPEAGAMASLLVPAP